MKSFIITGTMLLAHICYSQSSSLSFTYDAAGNQRIRELICVSCRTGTNTDDPRSAIQSIEHREISYYPNPVEEELYLIWQNENNSYVQTIETFSVSGQQLGKLIVDADVQDAKVPFLHLSQGTYFVVLNYSSGEKKSLNIIKK